MKASRRSSSVAGFTIIESLAALALLVVGGFVLLGGYTFLNQLTKRTEVSTSFDKQINEIASNIKAGIENYQVDFNFKENNDQDPLGVGSLPMVWDVGAAGTKEECPWCLGTYGYTIRPLEAMRGLYSVQVRFTHKSWGDSVRDISFVVSVK